MTLQLLQAVGQMHRQPDATRLPHLVQPMLAFQQQLMQASALRQCRVFAAAGRPLRPCRHHDLLIMCSK